MGTATKGLRIAQLGEVVSPESRKWIHKHSLCIRCGKGKGFVSAERKHCKTCEQYLTDERYLDDGAEVDIREGKDRKIGNVHQSNEEIESELDKLLEEY